MGIVYKPRERMWDTWVFQRGEDYHLFFLSKGNIGRAVSKDLIHWQQLPAIENMAGKGDWDEAGMKMTGSVTNVGDKYYLCYGSGEGTPIGLIVSDDLLTWERVGDSPVLLSAPPYAVGAGWRDMSAYYNEAHQRWDGYLYGVDGESGNPSIAHVSSADFKSWTYHTPVFVSEPYDRTNDGFIDLEVPDYFRMGSRHYLLFASVRSRKDHSSGRSDASGTWYLTADALEGPWRVPQNPLLLGSGNGRNDHYVGRTVSYGGERLLYHHTWGLGTVCWGTPKLVKQQEAGDLSLEYWPELDRLKTGVVYQKARLTSEPKQLSNALELFGPETADFLIECTVDMSGRATATLLWHHKPDRLSVATGLKIIPGESSVEMVRLEYLEEGIRRFNADTYYSYRRDTYTNPSLISDRVNVRILSRAHQVEIYLNGTWIFSMDVSDLPAEGNFGMLAENGLAQIEDMMVYSLEPIA